MRSRLLRLVLREDALRIVGISGDAETGIQYASEIELPMRILHASSADEVLAIASERSPRLFARDGGPLWEVSVIETMDGSGYPALSVLALFDHPAGIAR